MTGYVIRLDGSKVRCWFSSNADAGFGKQPLDQELTSSQTTPFGFGATALFNERCALARKILYDFIGRRRKLTKRLSAKHPLILKYPLIVVQFAATWCGALDFGIEAVILDKEITLWLERKTGVKIAVD